MWASQNPCKPVQATAMNTQTHLLMGAALFGRPLPRLALAGALGGIVPDAPMLAIVGGLRMAGYDFGQIFGKLYWEHWWQVANAIGHNFWLWGALALASGLMLAQNPFGPAEMAGRTAGERPVRPDAALVFAFSGSALLHSVIDFLSHRDDAHMHLWPLTQWRFRSPVSYWDPNHFGNWFGMIEAAIGVLLVVVLFRRYRNVWLRLALALATVLYLAVPAFFVLSIAGHQM